MGLTIVTGAGGLLGRETVSLLDDVRGLTHADLDISDGHAVDEAFAALRPSAAVHCASMTDVDACERDHARAWAVNADGVLNVVAAAERHGAYVVAVSTDYVFDGTKGAPYIESDEPNPIQEYGRSKLAGERHVSEPHAVVRSAWIYGRGGKNFPSRVPELAAKGVRIKGVADQSGSPTYGPDLARAIVRLLDERPAGTFHLVNAGSCSYLEFARHLLGQNADIEEVRGEDLNRPARRPPHTALQSCRVELLRPWRDAADEFARTS